MNEVKILIVEDELVIATAIASHLIKAGYQVSGKVQTGQEALLAVKNDKPDIIIMDIHLDGKKDGIDTASEIQKEHKIPVIFLTDHDDENTITRAGKVQPSTYLLKPFHERQVLVSIQHALLIASNQYNAEQDYNNYVLDDCLFIRKDKDSAFRKIPLNSIYYIEAERAYSHIRTAGGDYLQSISMNNVHQQIRHPSFIQVHRSYVVNLDKVDAVKGNVLMIGKAEITVSDTYKDDVMKRFPMLR